MDLELNDMIWVILWLYIVGTFNEFLFAVTSDVDMARWQSHLVVALWPITVPAAMLYTAYEIMTGKDNQP